VSPDDYCGGKAAPVGSSLYYAVQVLRPPRRRAVIAVHALCRELADVVREIADPGVADLKLGWWRAEIEAAFAGRPQHPVAQALAPVVASFELSRERFDALVDAAAADFDQRSYPDFGSLERHCLSLAGGLWSLSADIMGCSESATRGYALELGVALRLVAIIRDLGADTRRGRVYVPQDELARFGVDARELLRAQLPPGFTALMQHQAARARSRGAGALARLPRADRRAQRTGIIMAAIGEALLEEIERDGFRVLDRRIGLTPAAKAWIAWKKSWIR